MEIITQICEYIVELIVYLRVFIDYYINQIRRNNDFVLKDVVMYERDRKKRVINYFRFNDVKSLDKNIFERINDYFGLDYKEDGEKRLKFTFSMYNDEYIFYYSNRNVSIEYPMYNIRKIDEYREDIIRPLFNEKKEGISFYAFFTIDCKNIKSIKINGVQLKNNERRYFEKIKTPYNDFGLIYMNPIKVEWILEDLKVDKDKFKSMEIEFLNSYFNEEKMELEMHKFVTTNMEDIFITEQMKGVIDKRCDNNL